MSTPVVDIIVTLVVGLAAGVVAHRLRLPGGAIIGALAAVAVLHVSVPGMEPLGPGFRISAQIAIGAAIGVTLTRSPLKAVYRVLGPALLVIAILLGTSIGLAFTMAAVSDLPLVTALFSFAPGGASDMAAAALQLDADVGAIAAIHVVRQVAVFVIVVGAFNYYLRPEVTRDELEDPQRNRRSLRRRRRPRSD